MKYLRTRKLALSYGPTFAGWAVMDETGFLPQNRENGDPFDLALRQTRAGEWVDLIAYNDDASFQESQAFRDGLTRAQHIQLLREICTHLRLNGRYAELKFVTVENQ